MKENIGFISRRWADTDGDTLAAGKRARLPGAMGRNGNAKTVEKVKEVLNSPQRMRRMAVHNFNIASRYDSYFLCTVSPMSWRLPTNCPKDATSQPPGVDSENHILGIIKAERLIKGVQEGAPPQGHPANVLRQCG